MQIPMRMRRPSFKAFMLGLGKYDINKMKKEPFVIRQCFEILKADGW